MTTPSPLRDPVATPPTSGTSGPSPAISSRQLIAAFLAIAALAIVLRALFPLADPPWHAPVGVVWHDEGAWTHNARNRALLGVWQTDAWNPMYLAPVFAGLEFASFRAFGVGLWQARLVSEVMGLLAVLLLGLTFGRSRGRAAGLAAAALLATNYVWVAWNRAALMETTMIAFMVASLWAYERARSAPSWGALAGALAVLAFFTKAAAAFFVAALALEALIAAATGALPSWRSGTDDDRRSLRAGVAVWAGLAAAAIVALAIFVAPNWGEVRFYNWEMSVTRKPEYSLRAFVDRASWLPIVHDFFTRMWALLLLAIAGAAGVAVRWRRAVPAERLCALWIVLGVAETIVHDVGNERRLVFLIPPMAGLAASILGHHRRLLDEDAARVGRALVLAASPLLAYATYVAAGPIVRVFDLYGTRTGVRASAAVALVLTAAIVATWPRFAGALARARWTARASLILVCVLMAGDLAQYGQWAAHVTWKNYQAMVDLGRWLPPETLVHGKLANGLALENRIRPVFVGRGFGNYADRLTRDDIRYLVTYVSPRIGYEGPVIRDVLDRGGWRLVRTFPVAETTSGGDMAALFERVSAAGRQDAPERLRTGLTTAGPAAGTAR